MAALPRPQFNWAFGGILYTEEEDLQSASTEVQIAAVNAGIIKIGSTLPLLPRDCGRVGNREWFNDIRDVAVEFIEFLHKQPETRDSIPLQSTTRKVLQIAEALHHSLGGQSALRPRANITDDDQARELILFAKRVHQDQALLQRVERESGPLTSQLTITLFRDLAAIATDWWAQPFAVDPSVEFTRIIWSWGFPVNPKYLWIPLEDERDSGKISFYFEKSVMLPR